MAFDNTILITGGTAGLGYFATLEIARAKPRSLVVVSSRSDHDHVADTINSTLKQQNVVFLPLDLASLDNVRTYARQWPTRNYPPIHALVFNACLQFPGALQLTGDGIENTFAVAHVGHALLFHLLWPYLALEEARIVVTSSGVHDPAQKTGLPDAVYDTAEELAHPSEKTAGNPGRGRYSNSKLANMLWIYALNRRLQTRAPHVSVAAFDPGLVPGTGLARDAPGVERFVWNKIMPCILPLLHLAVSPNIHKPEVSGKALARLAVAQDVAGVSGKYYEGMKVIASSKDSYDEAKQEELWNWTVKFLADGDEEKRVRFDNLTRES
jgi:NAD(P)-dependent dehydrogenase (short-subunit alcohol dehydrogenase family)